MRKVFKDLSGMEGVQAVFYFSEEGDLLFKEMLLSLAEDPEKKEWWPLLIHSLSGIREMELVFDQGRVYIRKVGSGYLIVLLSVLAPVALLRLHCDTVLPSLERTGRRGGVLGRLFGKGRARV